MPTDEAGLGGWRPDGTELAVAFVTSRTGVAAPVRLGRRRQRRVAPDEVSWSAPGPDARDPVSLESVVDAVVTERGWRGQVSGHVVTGRWPEIVGPAVAEHARVERFDEGVLTVRCDSTAWATQLRMLVPDLLRRLAAEAGPDVVRSVEVRGPDAPSWVHGPRRVRGRGPRDTYG